MRHYILDTDHVSLYQRGHAPLKARIATFSLDQLSTTVITVEEQLRGRLAQIRKATSPTARVQAYRWFRETVDFFCHFALLDFDDAAAAQFETLRQHKIRIGTQDLRIAAIVLATGNVLVTRNRRDFVQVPGLVIDDWAS